MSETLINGLTGPHHYELAIESLIAKEVLQQRGYRSVKAHELPPEFADYQRRDGLLIPLRSVRGEIESYQLKPNKPRKGKNGKPIKYETAANAKQIIDVPAASLPYLGNPNGTLLITEGAKKADAGVSHGLKCVIGLQGVFGWRGKNEHGGTTALPDWEHIALKGRNVVIAFDSDVMSKPEVRTALDRLSGFLSGRGAKVQYILMPDLPDGGKCGLDDWFALDNHADNVAALDALSALAVSELPELAVASPVTGGARANIRRMSEVEAEEIDWLWPGWIPNGSISLLGGYAGDGKSTFTASLIAALTTGALLPDGTRAPLTNCLVMPAEDDVPHVVKPRLAIHGANINRVFDLSTVDAGDGTLRMFNMRTDMHLLAEEVQKNEIGLIVIDPISGFTPKLDRNSEGDVRDSMQPLTLILETYNCAVLGVMHMGKNSGHARSYQGLLGSSAYTALARSVLMLTNMPMTYQTPGEPQRKMIGVSKSNYAEAPKPIQYHRERDKAIEYLGPSPISLDAALNAKPSAGEDEKPATETAKAAAWLLEFMDGKPVKAVSVEEAAKEEGFSRTALYRVKKNLGIISKRRDGASYWATPDADDLVA